MVRSQKGTTSPIPATITICHTLRDLVPFVQFGKREKQTWRSVNFSFTKINTLPWVFFAFFKLYKWYQIPATITIFISIQFVWLYSLWLVTNLKDKIGQDAVKHRHESMNYKEFKKFLAKTMFFLLPHVWSPL